MNASPERPLIAADVPLAPRTTLGVGGSARWLASASDEDDLREALDWSREKALETFVLGGGSNIVVSDSGFDGLVIDVGLRGIACEERGGGVHLRVKAGESWDSVVDYAVSRGLAGIECLSGIPGKVGATPIQNVGAYGQEVSETVVSVESLSRLTGEHVAFSNADCGFGYRDSVFKRDERDRWIVCEVTFSLQRGEDPTIRYSELERRLETVASPSLTDVRHAVLELRRAKGMVIDQADPDSRSVGSFFMNPVLDDTRLKAFLNRVRESGTSIDSVPRFETNDGGTKLSAAWLIEHAGLVRGFELGSVGLSTKHALAIVNRGAATATAVVDLAGRIQSEVQDQFGIELRPEAQYVGF